jgi:hypothetical protein
MTLFDVEELTKYWAEHPPLHILVAAYLGAGKQQRRPTGSGLDGSGDAAGANPEEVLAELGPGFHTADVHAGLTPVVLDFAELRRQAATH